MAQFIGASAAAEILGVSRTTVWRLVQIGDLPAHDVDGRGNVFEADEVIALRDRRAVRTAKVRGLRAHGVEGVERVAS